MGNMWKSNFWLKKWQVSKYRDDAKAVKWTNAIITLPQMSSLVVFNIKQWLSIFNCKLCTGSHSSKHRTAFLEVLPKKYVDSLIATVTCSLFCVMHKLHMSDVSHSHWERYFNHWYEAFCCNILKSAFTLFWLPIQPLRIKKNFKSEYRPHGKGLLIQTISHVQMHKDTFRRHLVRWI